MSGIVKYGSGLPLAVTSPNNSNSLGGGTGMRPMVTGISAKLPGGPQIKVGRKYFNPAAFSRTPAYQFGNAPRYLADVDKPASKNFDALIEKNTQIYDHYALLFLVEMFNALNMVTFAGPTTDVTSVNFGTIASLSQTNDPREIQLSLRLRF